MALPHTFADGPGNTASGVEVTANDAYLETLANGKEAAFSTWKAPPFAHVGGGTAPSVAGGTYLMPGGHLVNAGIGVSSAGMPASWAFQQNPADYLAGTRTSKLRLNVKAIVNAVAPTVSFTVGLYPVSSYGGASGAAPSISAWGTVITGSTVLFTTPGAASGTNAVSSEFNAPTAGDYVLGVVVSGAMAAGSQVTFLVDIQMRQV